MDYPVILIAIISLISVLASLSVIITFFMFRDLRNKPFMRIITNISLADLFGNISYLILIEPSVEEKPALCGIQAYLSSALYPCSWLWTTTLSYFLYTLATEGFTPRHFLRFRLICWGFPTLLFLIETTFSGYSKYRDYTFEVCSADSETGTIYHNVTYCGLFLIALGYMWYLQIRIHFLLKEQSDNVTSPRFLAVRAALTYYPAALWICWTPHIITSLYCSDWAGRECKNGYYLGDVLKIFHGAVTAIIFYSKSREARRLWYKLICGKNPPGANFEVSAMSEERLLSSDPSYSKEPLLSNEGKSSVVINGDESE